MRDLTMHVCVHTLNSLLLTVPITTHPSRDYLPVIIAVTGHERS